MRSVLRALLAPSPDCNQRNTPFQSKLYVAQDFHKQLTQIRAQQDYNALVIYTRTIARRSINAETEYLPAIRNIWQQAGGEK